MGSSEKDGMGTDEMGSAEKGGTAMPHPMTESAWRCRDSATAPAFGDIGEWQPNGAMKIIDKKKNIFKLSQGEYIAVENLENTYNRCPIIDSIWVYGNSFESFLVAVVVPNKTTLEDWAETHDKSGDYQPLCISPRARKYILDERNSKGKKHKARHRLSFPLL
ncbi:hypothetical protein Syun_016584 [Stephania yunnanensis]|uniref:Uncharacterized protein n=1 Tax=Stephania yunnanensis TaxID=152371 RepID=A0AAP0J7R0_9MAGN